MKHKQLLEHFSTHLKNAMANAIAEATSRHHSEVTSLHLLYGLTMERGCIAQQLLKKVGFNKKELAQTIEKIKNKKTSRSAGQQNRGTKTMTLPELNHTAKQIVEKSMIIAYKQDHNYVGTEHLLSAMMLVEDPTIIDAFEYQGINTLDVEDLVASALDLSSQFPQMREIADVAEHMADLPDSNTHELPKISMRKKKSSRKRDPQVSSLEFFGTHLTSKAVQKTIDPIIGRQDEIERMIHILSRRNKNNPILIGEPGVGKTAIVEGLAKRIYEGDVPHHLKNKQVYSIDLALIVAGTMYRGEFEGRLKQLIDDISNTDNVIVFIDEIHNLVGAGSNQGTMDAANLLKPALARGKLHCIGATTEDEYHKYIKEDPALERRFQTVQVNEPSPEETLDILRGVSLYYENFHRVIFSTEALEAAVSLSNTYVRDNHQPDKSLDLLDEACAYVKTNKPVSILQHKIFAFNQELQELEAEKDAAIEAEALQVAISIKSDIANIKKELKHTKKKLDRYEQDNRPPVTADDVAYVLAKKLRISHEMLHHSEWDRLQSLSSKLKKDIIGQDHIVQQVTTLLQQKHFRMNTQKPHASFLFVGPSGVGKSHLAKLLSKELFHHKDSLIRLDMSEFTQGHSSAKLLGSPAGYIGYKDRNSFIEQLTKRPHSVVLFDEIDKAHPDVVKLLLQILDEGTLTDHSGKQVSFAHSVIILTANVNENIYKNPEFGFAQGEEQKKAAQHALVQKEIKKTLSPAVASRLDYLGVFNPLNTSDLISIATNRLREMNKHFKKRSYPTVNATKTTIKKVIDTKKHYNARKTERAVEQIIHSLLAEQMKQGSKKKKYTLQVKKSSIELV